ncbi:MAG: serine/threonine protein kinase [Actinobacteria bacterium]|nr:MAG: serine/threonine protein kinase [Actinomycetota bacterium]
MDALGDRSVTGEMVAGRYRLGDPLGSGGMAEVFDAMDERLERPVAIKLLRTELSGDPGLRRRFEIEARAAARLVHPNVVGVFDTGEVGGRPYIVMERLPGATLADRLREERMDEPGTRRLASEVLGALAAAHAAGILHRDVKPSNILWARDGSAKVADFGIAKGTERTLDTQTGDITATNLVIGTPAYLAPERLLGHPATPRSDLWSLGAVLYEALAGVRPFPSATALVHDPDQPEVVPLESRRPGLDPMLSTAIDRALARRPDQRFASAAEMAAAAGLSLAGVSAAAAGTELATARLERQTQGPTELMDGRTAIVGDDAVAEGPVAPPGPSPEADQRARRLRALALLAVVLIALAAIGIAVALRGNGGSTPGTTTTTTVPATTAVTRPSTTLAPTTTSTRPPTTTTTSPTTTSSSSTTTSSTTSTTSGVLGRGGGGDHKAGKAANGGG